MLCVKTVTLFMCTNVVEKTHSYFTQYPKATLDVQLLPPECPAQHRTGPLRLFPRLGLLQASRVGLYAAVPKKIIKLQTFLYASLSTSVLKLNFPYLILISQNFMVTMTLGRCYFKIEE